MTNTKIITVSVMIAAMLTWCTHGRADMCDDTNQTISLGSIHLNTKQKFNEANLGFGMECNDYQAGVYHNSIGKTSVYIGRSIVGNPYTGVKYGLVTGYMIPLVPYVAGYIRVYNIELTFIPPTGYNPLTIGYSLRW